jgi:hypothetical protein
MPYLNCPRCHRTAWLRTPPDRAVACRHCGTELDPMPGSDVRFLTRAVRERFARDRRKGGPPRFIREPRQLPD